MRKQIKSWIEANATDNAKVLEIEAVAEKFALRIEFLSSHFSPNTLSNGLS